MSPILFNLFINPILRSLKNLLPNDVFHELFSFIDDIALQTPSPRVIHTTPNFLFTIGPKYGLSFNTTKSELHALNDTPHMTIIIAPTLHFSTCDTNGEPRLFYKYLAARGRGCVVTWPTCGPPPTLYPAPNSCEPPRRQG